MINFKEIKQGNYVIAETKDQRQQVEVVEFNRDEKEIAVNNGVQDFFMRSDSLFPIPVNEKVLLDMKFSKKVNEDGSVKYMKGAFRMQTPSQDDFSHYDIWYRDERRHIMSPIFLHQLQNHYEELTKVKLTNREV